MTIAVICGGVGAAKFLRGLVQVVAPETITAIVNTGDDITLHGLHVSPDLDTCTYTLAEAINPETGWGLANESWNAMDTLGRYGGVTWFNLGDRDLGTHLYRTHRLRDGASLSQVTAEITAAWGLELAIVPMTNDPVTTMVTTSDEGEIGFQEYFVRRQHSVAVEAVRFAGVDAAEPAPGVLDALDQAEVIVVAPSNPIVSIGPVMAVPGMAPALEARRERVAAISPIVGGEALKGPAADMMAALGTEASVVGVAELYQRFASALIIDDADHSLAADVQQQGLTPVVTSTIMSGPDEAAALARHTIAAIVDKEI